jgi:hypothetical protein
VHHAWAQIHAAKWGDALVERLRREDRGAEGAEGVGSGEGIYPLPSRLGGLGERCELPQRDPGRSPGRQRFWYILSMKERRWWHLKVSHFGSMIIGNFYYFSFFFKLMKQFATLLSVLKYRGNCLVKCQSNKYHIVTPLQSQKISMPLLLLLYVLNV